MPTFFGTGYFGLRYFGPNYWGPSSGGATGTGGGSWPFEEDYFSVTAQINRLRKDLNRKLTEDGEFLLLLMLDN